MNKTVLNNEIQKRRTFAIISHPDAGKTTLTEKLLLYGGALELAGSVTAKKKQSATSSDWMELEKKRGISISSTVLQFDFEGFKLNLLDTPGHKDFSEDTYRVLMAVDFVIMVIDAGKGIESQTLKLFEICRKRDVPIFTFINKLDRPSLPPLDLIDELEKVLNIHAYPANWPLDNGPEFKGVFDRLKKEFNLFERVPGGSYRVPVALRDASDPFIKEILHSETFKDINEELEMLEVAQEGFDHEAVLSGKTTPVFFGSAVNNFGVELLLKNLIKYSCPPVARTINGKPFPMDSSVFSAFIFKIQTNMDPRHRDRMVFARICSGKFTRDMTIINTRSKKEVRLSSSHTMFGRDREITEEAYPGDIIGFVTNADFSIGDTISSDPSVAFNEIPRFAPECFAYLLNSTMSAAKSFRKGLDHLLAEHIVQCFYLNNNVGMPLLGAVGPLQFEILQYRLRDEYSTETRLEMKQWEVMRWLPLGITGSELEGALPYNSTFGCDDQNRHVLFFQNQWGMKSFQKDHPDIELYDNPPVQPDKDI
ncbi:MAG: peptide chain release factor 3 [Spirochaetes bacterium]|jgi:peptide chain release factor 3|nr:peptide chain release factor 3 [Spirochaetota bacterium]